MKIQVGDIERDMTDAEIAQHNKDIADAKKAETERAKQKQAVLDRLGITADEAALLLG
jgi:hypothetical protein